MLKLTQAELNASTIIRGLIDIQIINFDPKYGYGNETRELIIEHISGWDEHVKKELRKKLIVLYAILGGKDLTND
jgi:hypothetical protein